MGAKSRRARLEQLLNLAQTYRGWTRKQLAKSLGRDTTKLVPESGLPKLDLLMDLSRVLDWSVNEVAAHIWAGQNGTASSDDGDSFDGLAEDSKAAHRDGRYNDALEHAERAYKAAQDGEQRAIACIREFNAWDGLGRYTQAVNACRRGLSEEDVSTQPRLMLQANLASGYYTLWQLLEAKTMAQDLIQRYESDPPADRVNRVIQAFAFYVRGNSYRRLMSADVREAERCGRQAKKDLMLARTLHEELQQQFDEDAYGGIANTCQGGLIEVEVALGQQDPGHALQVYAEHLNEMIDPDECPKGDWLESYGWWCIFGCNVALRHCQDARTLQQYMALFTNKADEIARRLDNWSMRERVFTMDFARRQRFADWTGVDTTWTIDKEDLRIITGTMGRFPQFHTTGWQILESAKLIAGN